MKKIFRYFLLDLIFFWQKIKTFDFSQVFEVEGVEQIFSNLRNFFIF
jgi:hypothetical protein